MDSWTLFLGKIISKHLSISALFTELLLNTEAYIAFPFSEFVFFFSLPMCFNKSPMLKLIYIEIYSGVIELALLKLVCLTFLWVIELEKLI